MEDWRKEQKRTTFIYEMKISKSEIALDANHFETLPLWDVWKKEYIVQDSTNSTRFQYMNGLIVDILNR